MEHLGLVEQLHFDVRLVVLDLREDRVERLEIIRSHGVAKAALSLLDFVAAVIVSADRSLRNQAVLVLEHPVLRGAELAVEITARLAVELDVSEVKLGAIALLANAVGRVDTALDQLTCLRVSGKIKRSVTSSIFQVQINTKLHKALENLNLRIGGSLMDAIVAMLVLNEWIHLLFH